MWSVKLKLGVLLLLTGHSRNVFWDGTTVVLAAGFVFRTPSSSWWDRTPFCHGTRWAGNARPRPFRIARPSSRRRRNLGERSQQYGKNLSSSSSGGSLFDQDKFLSSSALSSSSSSSPSPSPSPTNSSHYTVEVSYEGRSCQVHVLPEETILSAMERMGTADRLCLHSLPHDCRRGNCMTCSGRHEKGSNRDSLVVGDDGLSPHMSEQFQSKGYVLTCSSYVAGEGLKLRLGENHRAWQSLLSKRLTSKKVQRVSSAAVAKLFRLRAERDIERWKRETEESLRKSGEDANILDENSDFA